MYSPQPQPRSTHVPLRADTGLRLDERTGIIRVAGPPSWSAKLVAEHFQAVRALVARVRASGRPVLVLLDLSQCSLESGDVAAQIREDAARLRRPGDRIAIMAGSSLLKMQIRRALPSLGEIFISESAAETWLTAYSTFDTN